MFHIYQGPTRSYDKKEPSFQKNKKLDQKYFRLLFKNNYQSYYIEPGFQS